jgi:hypothetical protein
VGTFRVSIDINRSTDDVFAFVAEPRNMPLWYDAVTRVTPVAAAGPTNAARYRITRSLPTGRADNLVEVIESTSNRTVTFTSHDEPTPFDYRYAITQHDAGTRLTLDADISSAGLPGPLAHLDAIATSAFKRGMQRNLEELKRHVESTFR